MVMLFGRIPQNVVLLCIPRLLRRGHDPVCHTTRSSPSLEWQLHSWHDGRRSRMRYSNEELTNMVLLYGRFQGNTRDACREYRRRYPELRSPCPSVILRAVRNLRRHGRLVAVPVRGMNQQVRRRALEEAVATAATENPHAGTRSLGMDLGVSHMTVWRVLKALKFHPYHIHVHQDLHGEDNLRRIEFCIDFLARINEDDQFLRHVLFTDESTFHNDGTVNRHNLHYWSRENPSWLRAANFQNRFKVNVWCGILGDRILGPYFLEGNLTSDMYLQLLTHDVQDDLPLDAGRVFFQQDGAPPHGGRNVTQFLNNAFPGRWFGRYGPNPWPARSPDLTPLDFFLWGYVKERVYDTQPVNVVDLRDRIRRVILAVTPEMLRAVRRAVVHRLYHCLTADGWNFEQLL